MRECASLGEEAETGEELWNLGVLVVGLEEGWVGRGSLCPTGEGGKSIQMPGR